MARKKRVDKTTPVESVKHKDKRANIPTEELRDFVKEDENQPKTILYPRDPSLDPQLVWKGKDEQEPARPRRAIGAHLYPGEDSPTDHYRRCTPDRPKGDPGPVHPLCRFQRP